MILRRFAQNLKEQNWAAIGIEFVLLVLGVFLGIQVANWNEARQQAAREASYLERMRADFIGIRKRVELHLTFYGDAMQGGELLLSIVRAEEPPVAGVPIEHAAIERALDTLSQTRNPPPLPATYLEMRSQGQLNQIANPALRDRLAEYDRFMGVLQELTRIVNDNAVRQIPALFRHVTSRTVLDDTQLSGIREDLISYDIAGMRSDREFAVAVKMLHRFAVNTLPQRRRQIEMIDEIVALIDSNLERKP